jgi:hypothetical protein
MSGAHKHIVDIGRSAQDKRRLDRLFNQLEASEAKTEKIRQKIQRHINTERLKPRYSTDD